MCRKARMFAPLKIWRKWHQKCNVQQRRHAVASALAASACTPLVMARGHRVENVPELPLVVDGMNGLATTKALLTSLEQFGCGDDLSKVRKSRKIRAGHGKYRNSKYVMRKGPLIVHGDDEGAVKRAARNLPGVDTCSVTRLNILQLAPGGHLGRFLVFTKAAFKSLNTVFGTHRADSQQKKGYHLNRTVMACTDLSRIINSDQVQAKLRGVRQNVRAHNKTKANPLKSKALMLRLNPYATKQRELIAKREADRHAKKAAAIKAKRAKAGKLAKNKRTALYHDLQGGMAAAFKAAEDVIAEEEKQGNYVPGDTDEEEGDDA